MRILLIGCEVIIRELCDAISRSPHIGDARFLAKGLHDRGARAMREGVQAAIDEAEMRAEEYDAIALGSRLCGNGLAGVQARSIPPVLPRAHDCLTLVMGSRTRFEGYFRTTRACRTDRPAGSSGGPTSSPWREPRRAWTIPWMPWSNATARTTAGSSTRT
jgi:Protein of unknown function (DUF1638)